MASYYDEHNCQPPSRAEAAGDRIDEGMLRLVRMLLSRMDQGETYLGEEDLEDMADRWDDFGLAPPASKEAVENLARYRTSDEQIKAEMKCPVCLVPYSKDETLIEMPCGHTFHSQCILPWLQKTNSCPNCRHELPTDDKAYEQYKKEKEEEKARELRVEEYHDSMFG